ncbi:hypothetical protein [Marinibactrum halimedae]|uniref:Uncharacterized protein n=1 Tax=Marinibactrum halimedae TaxID=1444977 RepID=A0AA37T8B2_9GAMM|nr:hypothetical protein [Marinibactrum halimedae]MCD9461086.1 hypothetical protein [Marinibactrum halimedae]GLS25736.1 hypothetical protein GCM10007877_14500 [Marinibactrum halimedae]
MAKYCRCHTCSNSPAQPNDMASNNPENVLGPLVQLGPNDILVHWSSRQFTRMMSTEIAHIDRRGVNPEPVCCSFYLYRNSQGPNQRPPQLRLLGLGGDYRYVIDNSVMRTPDASIYMKSNGMNINGPTEVVVVVGCGGYISFPNQPANTGLPGVTSDGINRQE